MKLAVVGGGIAGLAAAHRAVELARERGQRLELALFEAGDRLGGTIQTERHEGFLVECQSGDKWVRSWNAALNNGLPKAVRVTVTVRDGEKTADYSVLATPRMIP